MKKAGTIEIRKLLVENLTNSAKTYRSIQKAG